MHLSHKSRWIFSPLVISGDSEKPLASEYAVQWEAPMHFNGFALTHCVMNAHQLAAAKKNPHLVVLPSIYLRQPIPNEIADHHAAHGVKRGMLLHEALCALAAHHPNFEPEN